MKETTRKQMFKISSIAAMFLFVYPAVYFIRTLLFGDDGGIAGFLLAALFLAAGYTAGRTLIRDESRIVEGVIARRGIEFIVFLFNKSAAADNSAVVRTITTAAAYLALVLPALVSLFLFSGAGFLRTLYEVPVSVIFYVIGLRAELREYEEVLSNKKIYFGIFIFSTVLITSYYHKGSMHLRPSVFIFACIFMVISMLLRSQVSLDFNVFSRHGMGASEKLRNIRKFNILLVMQIALATLLLFNLRGILLLLFGMAGEVFKMVVVAILKLMMLLFPGGGEAGMNGGAPSAPNFFGGGGAENPFMNFVYNVIKNFILLYALYKILPVVWRKLAALAAFLKKLAGKLFEVRKRYEVPETEEYSEEIEIVKVRDVPKRKSSFNRRLRAAKRQLNSIADPVEKIRFIYALLLELLAHTGLDLKDSDTTGEICGKARRIQGIFPHFADVTGTYDNVRYGDLIPGRDNLSDSEKKYLQIAESLRRQK